MPLLLLYHAPSFGCSLFFVYRELCSIDVSGRMQYYYVNLYGPQLLYSARKFGHVFMTSLLSAHAPHGRYLGAGRYHKQNLKVMDDTACSFDPFCLGMWDWTNCPGAAKPHLQNGPRPEVRESASSSAPQPLPPMSSRCFQFEKLNELSKGYTPLTHPGQQNGPLRVQSTSLTHYVCSMQFFFLIH